MRLSTLLGRIPEQSFYGRKFSGLALAESTTLEDFQDRCPFTLKSEFVADQSHFPPYGSNHLEPLERFTRFHQTSGTTGTPLRWLDTNESWNSMVESWTRVFQAAGVSSSDRVLFAFSFGPFLGFWLAFEAGQRIGALCLPAGGLSSVARLRMLLDNEVTALCCTPTYALRLAEVAAREKIDLCASKIRLIMVAGEPGGSIPATREQLSGLWNGARIFDHHGMTEVGPVTYECPKTPGTLHVIDDAYLAEVCIPGSSKLAAVGEAGELILTTLTRLGSPAIRYRTGDLVRAEKAIQPCLCGSCETRLVGGILGRIDDMVIVRGVNLYPSAIEDLILRHRGVREYQVILQQVSGMTDLRMEIEAVAEAPNTLAHDLELALQSAFSLRVPVVIVPAGTLPRSEMKAKRWVRK
ncbi:MAG: AMP-binding protein [Verrucomicrobiota bacterium]|nr:AMP-binding protein [Verrucomicrobiota bacterium]